MAQVVLVKDINPSLDDYGYANDSNPDNFIEFDDKLYFRADDGENGDELWVSDGTPAGTQLLLDINPRISSSDDFYNFNSSDSNATNFIEFDNKLYFTADDGENGDELWVSDGTPAGTQLLLDINPRISSYYGFYNSYYYGSNAADFIEFDDKLYFAADDGENGRELWVSDGTTSGTQLLLDINPGISNYGYYYDGSNPSSSNPDNFIEFNDKLYFTADDGENGYELWVSDGTTSGTQLLLDINPGISNYGYAKSSYASNFIEFDDKLFFTANDGENGHELWVSDGTTSGTQLLLDINPGMSNYGSYPGGSSLSDFIEFDDKLFFTADYGENGRELWVSDGTSSGTQLLLDINSYIIEYGYEYGFHLSNFTEFDGKLYFTANEQLWVSDGTTAGTKSLVETNLGYGSIIVVDDELFFNADDSVTGNELYKLTFDDSDDESYKLTINDSDADITYITGDYRYDHLIGGDGIDHIKGLSGNDTLGGKAGNDILNGGHDNDALFGADGHDILTGDYGNDVLRGQSGQDVLNGGKGNDTLFGGNQFDHLSGGRGGDVLDDFRGVTIYNGGAGSDIFVIHDDAQTDWIQDFELGVDQIRLVDGITFEQLEITGHDNSFLSFQGERIAGLLGVNPNGLDASNFQEA